MLHRRLACGWIWVCLLGVPGLAQEGVPRNLVIVQPAGGAAETQVNLRWDPIPGALGYEVLRKRNGSWWLNEEDPNCTPITNSTSITGLSPDTAVEFCVRAVLPKGLSANSAPATARTQPLGTAPIARKEGPTQPLPVVDDEPPARPAQPPPVRNTNADPDPVPVSGSITDLVPPPPKPKATPATPKEERPKGPPPPAPEGLMGLFTGKGDIRLSWRMVAEATGYLVEEEREGQWVSLEDGIIQENRPSLIVKGHGGAGPYLFRVRAVRHGQRSSVSLPTKVER
ncbi:fibronectin type III domain-containing protein [bacterium]|nr:fibronectin type III domain-containing protein [bacterium]